jgi:hypothetical protein
MRPLQPKTIKAYLSSVRSLHVDAGLPFDAIESPTLQRLIRGVKQYYGEKGRRPKRPITLSILQAITSPSLAGDLSVISNAVLDAAFKVAWSGFLRTGEFTLGDRAEFDPVMALTRDSVQFLPSFDTPTHVRLTLPASKTDPFRQGVSIIIAAVPGLLTCPVAALKNLFTVHPLPLKSPLFADALGAPLRRSSFISELKRRITLTGLDSTEYAGHSFRRGAATSAAAAGYSDYEVQLLGRWRSDAYKLYIDVPADRLLHLSSRLHVAVAHAQLPGPLALHFASVVA